MIIKVKNFYSIAKKTLKFKIIYTSSGAVYGKQKKINLDLKENFNRNKEKFENIKKEEYAKTKIKNEKIFKKLLNYKIKISIVRCLHS